MLLKLVTIADTCIQRRVTVDDEQVTAVHITDETDVNYTQLKQKWVQHLPLGKDNGDPLEDLKNIFPAMFDGLVGLFDEEI